MLRKEKFTLVKEDHKFFQRRYMVTFVAFLCGVVTQTHRINISFAMVAMVNTTNTQHSLRNQTLNDCESSYFRKENTRMKTPEFDWDPEIQGYILSSGFVGYVLTQFPGGYLVRRFGVKLSLFSSIFGASLCNLVSPAVARMHPYFLAAVHFIKGMCQGPPSAAFALLAANWFPIQERGFLACFLYLGFPTGGFIGSLISGPISEINVDGGWPLIFYTFGIFGVVVSILILCLYAETPTEDTKISEKELQYILENTKSDVAVQQPPIPWKEILTSTSTYVFFISLFGQYWMIFYLLITHPIYMDTILHIPVKENGLLTSGPQLTQAIFCFCTCWLSIWVKHKNIFSVNSMRKGYNTLASTIYALGMLGLCFSGCDQTLNEILLFVVSGSAGLSFAGCLIIAPDVTPTFCGFLMGLGCSICSVPGFILPLLVGYLTKEEQTMVQWHKMFLITASIVFVSGIVFLTLGDIKIQPYDPAHTKKESNATKEEIKEKITIPKY